MIMNKKTRALTEEQYRKIITTINEGFVTAAGERVKPNSRIATALTLEANLGLRISDILHLTINQIVKDGDRYRLDLVEQKTGKKREFTVPTEIYIYIQNYALENNINPRARLFQITERTVQRHLKMVCDYLEYEYISTHSFRKFFASSIYKDNGCDINLVRVLLQLLVWLQRNVILVCSHRKLKMHCRSISIYCRYLHRRNSLAGR